MPGRSLRLRDLVLVVREDQVVAAGVRGGSASLSTTGGSPTLTFDCAAASGGDGAVPRGWILKAGSYREPSDP
jgi:hypothetical protein